MIGLGPTGRIPRTHPFLLCLPPLVTCWWSIKLRSLSLFPPTASPSGKSAQTGDACVVTVLQDIQRSCFRVAGLLFALLATPKSERGETPPMSESGFLHLNYIP